MRRLTTLFPSELLEDRAEELGVVERDGKLQMYAFMWSFVFGFAAGRAEHLLASGAVTTVLPINRSHLVGSTSG